jgi:hypothetical protein
MTGPSVARLVLLGIGMGERIVWDARIVANRLQDRYVG